MLEQLNPVNLIPKVICGFPGVGKTTLFNELKDRDIKIVDSDSSKFDKANFPANYIEHIKEKLAEGYYILCSTHSVVRQALANADIVYLLVIPASADQKPEYMARYQERGSPQPFLDLMEAKWDEFMFDVWNDENSIIFPLWPGQYLDTLVDKITT